MNAARYRLLAWYAALAWCALACGRGREEAVDGLGWLLACAMVAWPTEALDRVEGGSRVVFGCGCRKKYRDTVETMNAWPISTALLRSETEGRQRPRTGQCRLKKRASVG